MRIPETPKTLRELELMQRLEAYSEGKDTWDPQVKVGPDAQAACQALYANTTSLVEKALAPILDRIGAREMDTFTMHDKTHGLKVAHLMWQILDPARRLRLTPPEIALLVLAAYLHDVGMALTREERAERLSDSSDLWEKLDVDPRAKDRMEKLRAEMAGSNAAISRLAQMELSQMEEALLSQDTRERHATAERYEQVISSLREFHNRNPESIPGIDECLSFDGNSFRNKLVDICVSHNEDSEALLRRDSANPARPRFPTSFPVGSCTADLHMIGAALRLSDILDFDRERTPPVLYYYLIPTELLPDQNRSALEWGKHMAISHWHIDEDALVFRGRCNDHIIHHAVVLFCAAIQEEIHSTRATFSPLNDQASWPIKLPVAVKSEIHEEGYHYVPYRFELDDQRIYSLLMGGAIYDNPLVAVRELVQNAVDACKLRDALTQSYEPYTPVTTNRIFVTYEEPKADHNLPSLSVFDTGTGMDAFILETYFLKVGQSYYNSQEFKRDRAELRKNNLDFAPISEFGIGFLSCFLLADRVEVETAMWESSRGDTRKRTLLIDGPTRLIRLKDEPNGGSKRFKGTRVTLHLRRPESETKHRAQEWKDIRNYLESVCRELPYRLHLRHSTQAGVLESHIDPSPLKIDVPTYLEPAILRIPVKDEEFGLEGELGLTNLPEAQELERGFFKNTSLALATEAEVESERRARYHHEGWHTELRRGGFKIGTVPGLPRNHLEFVMSRAQLRLTWLPMKERRYAKPNLARNGTADDRQLEQSVARAWVSYLLTHRDELKPGQLHHLDAHRPVVRDARWLENFNAYDVYGLARLEWIYSFKGTKWESTVERWEAGELDFIWLGDRYDLSSELLELVLPRISTLLLGPNGTKYASRPTTGWLEVLGGWREFVTKPARWPSFVEFSKAISELFFYEYPGCNFFNSKYKDRAQQLGDDRLKVLAGVLYEVIRAHDDQRLLKLGRKEADVLNAAIEIAGDLPVGSSRGSWPLRKFALAQRQDP